MDSSSDLPEAPRLRPDDSGPIGPDLDHLTSYIVAHHHGYLREICPIVNTWLARLVARHGRTHPELDDVWSTFTCLSEELLAHLLKEEHVLFPFIDELARANRSGIRAAASPFGTLLNPVRVMEADHQHALDLVARLRELTGGYTPPDDGCDTYRQCYAELARFERDLLEHIRLENQDLFPRAVELETASS